MSADEEHLRLKEEKGWILIFIIFGMERLLLYSASILAAVIPDVPEDVMDELERKHFVLEEESRKFEHEKRVVEEAKAKSQSQGLGSMFGK